MDYWKSKWTPLLDKVESVTLSKILQNSVKEILDPIEPKKDPWVITPNQIVSVQPMTQPVGGIAFYMPRYADPGPKLIQGRLFDD
jgi:hypothetical protein